MKISLNSCNPGFELQVMGITTAGHLNQRRSCTKSSNDLTWAVFGAQELPTDTTSPSLSDHHAMEPKGMA